MKLTLACNEYDRTRPLFDGRVKPEGLDLAVTVLKPRQLFPRMLGNPEFDAGELSLASYATLVARGESPFVAIPVPLSRVFRHSCIYVRTDAGIRTPQDLKGKRVGTTQYGATAVVFMRGLLQDEYGVAAREMSWVIGGLTEPIEKPLIPLHLPPDIDVEFATDRALEEMLERGDLDALMSIY